MKGDTYGVFNYQELQRQEENRADLKQGGYREQNQN